MRMKWSVRTVVHRAFLAALVLLLPVILYLALPVSTRGLASHSRPAAEYAEAVAGVESLRATEAVLINPLAGTAVLTHGKKTNRVVVLYHGFTRSPHQFQRLGMLLYEKGYTVIIPRVPHHGLADRMTRDQERLTAEELVSFVDSTLDIARGYGDSITVAGFSMGGVMAAQAAQHRSDVERAVIIAPALGVKAIPTPLTGPVIRLALFLPNTLLWWDTNLRESACPPHAYPKFSTRALAQIMRLGCAVRADARRFPPAAHSILVVTNAGDPAVNNRMAGDLVRAWRVKRAFQIQTYEFPVDRGLTHELFEPMDYGEKHEQALRMIAGLIAP